MMLRYALATVLIVGFTVDARAVGGDVAASKDATFRRGNDAYYQGRYADAIEAYEQVSALGIRAADLFYNLGNAYLKSGQMGPAIYNYERALELNPSDEDAQFNLKAAGELNKKKGEDRLVGAEVLPLWMRMVQPYTLSLLSWVFLALYLAVFVLLTTLRFTAPGFLRVGLWATFAFLLIGTVLAGTLLGGRIYLADRVEQAIVLPDSVQVKEGPDPNYQPVFAVHAGLRVRITEKEQDWVRVRLSNGLEGWLRERDVGRL